MDHWDPAVIDGFAKYREVILFNNAGVRFAKSRHIAFHVLYGRQK